MAVPSLKKQSKETIPKVLKGQVINMDSGEPILFGTVAIYKNDVLITGVETDLEGKFSIEVPYGADVEAQYIGYEFKKIKYRDLNFEDTFQIGIKEGVLLGSVVTTGIFFVERKDSWLKRKWTKFKSLVKESHAEAQENKIIEENEISNSSESTTSIIEINSESQPIDDSKPEVPTEENIHVYPNPSSGIFQIEIPLNVEDFYLEVTDMNNQLILRKSKAQFNGMIDLSNYPSGNYVISIISNNRLFLARMVQKI